MKGSGGDKQLVAIKKAWWQQRCEGLSRADLETLGQDDGGEGDRRMKLTQALFCGGLTVELDEVRYIFQMRKEMGDEVSVKGLDNVS